MHQNQSPNQQMVISGVGMISPVGLDAAQACGSIRAGISRFQQTENYYCLAAEADLAEPEPLVWACVPGISAQSAVERQVALAARACAEVINDAAIKRRDMPYTYVTLILSENRLSQAKANTFFAKLQGALGFEFQSEIQAKIAGRIGWFEALKQTSLLLQQGICKHMIVLAVDSLLENGTLQMLDQNGRLKSERNLDGFIPGEAAAAVLLETSETAMARNAKIRAVVEGIGVGSEPQPFDSNGVCLGDGLTHAVSESVPQKSGARKISWVISDCNGESHRGKEWGHCLNRLLNHLNISHDWYPATALGETGAATAGIACVLAANSWEHSVAPASVCLVVASGEGAGRGALVLSQAAEW